MRADRKKRRDFTTQFLRVLEHEGPSSDRFLKYYLKILGYSPSSVPRKRRELAEKHLIESKKARVLPNGHLERLWERTK
jgi:hypothetical protein